MSSTANTIALKFVKFEPGPFLLFELDAEAIDDIRLALSQGQPLGNSRFLASIEKATGQRREAKPRGRPRKPACDAGIVGEQLSIEM